MVVVWTKPIIILKEMVLPLKPTTLIKDMNKAVPMTLEWKIIDHKHIWLLNQLMLTDL